MNFKQRLRKLERIAHHRLAVAAAEAAVCIEEGPPLTEAEARRLDPHALLAHIEVELHPASVRESEHFARHYARFQRLPLLDLWRLFPDLMLCRRKVMAHRRKHGLAKGSDQYYQFLKNIYGEMTDELSRRDREERTAKREPAWEPAYEPAAEPTPQPTPAPTPQPRRPSPQPVGLSWAMA